MANLVNDVFKIRRYQSSYEGLEILKNAPLKPDTPSGPPEIKKGIKYSYSSCSIDPQGDKIYYLFDWGDKTDSGLVGPFNSSEVAISSHIWKKSGKYEIKVKAIDINNYESEWPDSLLVNVPRDKLILNFYCKIFFTLVTRSFISKGFTI